MTKPYQYNAGLILRLSFALIEAFCPSIEYEKRHSADVASATINIGGSYLLRFAPGSVMAPATLPDLRRFPEVPGAVAKRRGEEEGAGDQLRGGG
jgi:hypothetical protein